MGHEMTHGATEDRPRPRKLYLQAEQLGGGWVTLIEYSGSTIPESAENQLRGARDATLLLRVAGAIARLMDEHGKVID